MLRFRGKELDSLIQSLVPLHLMLKHHLLEFTCMWHHPPGDLSSQLVSLIPPKAQYVVIVSYVFLEQCESLNCINQGSKIAKLSQLDEPLFQDAINELHYLSKTKYTFVNHDLLSAFIERWHSETSSFHILLHSIFCFLRCPSKLIMSHPSYIF